MPIILANPLYKKNYILYKTIFFRKSIYSSVSIGNIYFIVFFPIKLRNQVTQDTVGNNGGATSYPMAIYRHFRPSNRTDSDLFFISLPPNRQNPAIATAAASTAAQLGTAFVGGVGGFNSHHHHQQHDNLAYLHDDEPPSYYDAVLVKNTRLSVAKQEEEDQTTDIDTTSPVVVNTIAHSNNVLSTI